MHICRLLQTVIYQGSKGRLKGFTREEKSMDIIIKASSLVLAVLEGAGKFCLVSPTSCAKLVFWSDWQLT